jgi:riboflavin synthase
MYYRTKKRQRDLKNWGLIVGHLILEFVIGYIVGWSIIILTFSDDHSLFINYIIAPFVGFVAGIYIDHKILLPLNTLFTKADSKNKDDNKSSNNITVNINTDNNENTNRDEISTGIEDLLPLSALDSSIIGTNNFEEILVSTINALIDSGNKQTEELKQQMEKIKKNTSTLNALRDSEMINKRVELKKLIYDCLNKGYATPEENDKITQYYLAYIELGGNHEVQTLYEQHYLKLSVHEDRRRMSVNEFNMFIDDATNYNGPDRRQSNRKIYSYGEFDSEPLLESDDTKAIESKDTIDL